MTTGSASPLVVVGDVLLDRDVEGSVDRLAPDAPAPVVDERRERSRPGGAGLAACLAAASGRATTLITALAPDPAGGELKRLLAEAGVEVVDLGLTGETPEKIRIRAGGRTLLRLDRGGDGEPGPASAAARAALGWAGAVLVSDYGKGVAAEPGLRDALARRAGEVALVWDPHLRGTSPVAGTTLATPNAAEARRLAEQARGPGAERSKALAVELARAWRAAAVCVTQGKAGAVLGKADGQTRHVPASAVRDGDACGAGDRFASRAAELLAGGAAVEDAVAGAVAAASAFVAAGGAAGFDPRRPVTEREGGPDELAEAVRSGGGTVVATGGCFDLVHAGHLSTLTSARELGDCLIVCVNSDRSVRRLKGAGRPLVGERDRVAVLSALSCVDAVMVFDDDTPDTAIERLRPDVWVKGGDYLPEQLPERELVERCGGRVVTLPYLDGHSTTRLIEEAKVRAAG